MKYKLFLVLLLIIIPFYFGCREDIVEFSLEESTADVIIRSTPGSAEIFLNNRFTGKFTPDTLKYLDPGSYNIRLSLAGYRDSSVTLQVEAEDKRSLFISLTQR